MEGVDDIFNDNEDHKVEEKIIFSQNWKRVVEPIKLEGFREGIAAGREAEFQSGFDSGYSTGFEAGLSIGYYNSILKTLVSHKFKVPPTLDLDVTKLTQIDNPTRGICHLCTNDGKLLNKSEIESNLDASSNISLNEVIANQKSIIDNKVMARQKLPEFVKILNSLELEP